MGVNDHRHCVSGWHALQTDGRNGVRFRWIAEEAVFRLVLPPSAREMRLLVSGPAALTGRPAPLSLCAGTTLLAHLPAAAPTDFWTVITVNLTATDRPHSEYGGDSYQEFTIRSEERCPDGAFESRTITFDRYTGNGDHRPLGLMVGGIRVL